MLGLPERPYLVAQQAACALFFWRRWSTVQPKFASDSHWFSMRVFARKSTHLFPIDKMDWSVGYVSIVHIKIGSRAGSCRGQRLI
jgi:hypothetical protein